MHDINVRHFQWRSEARNIIFCMDAKQVRHERSTHKLKRVFYSLKVYDEYYIHFQVYEFKYQFLYLLLFMLLLVTFYHVSSPMFPVRACLVCTEWEAVWVGMFNSDIYSDRHSNITISGYHFRITNIIANVASAKLPLIREHKTLHTRNQWIASDQTPRFSQVFG